MTDADILRLLESDPDALVALVDSLPLNKRQMALDYIRQLAHGHRVERARTDFRAFCRAVQPGYIDGQHLRLMTSKLNDVAEDRLKRLIVCVPPRHPVWEGHRVLMADGGYRTVRDLQVGDRVITHQGCSAAITDVHIQGELPTLCIKTHHGRELYVHDTHPMWTPEGWVAAGDLSVKQSLGVVLQPAVQTDGRTRWRDLYPETVVDVPLDAACELMGYVVGDGSLACGKRVGLTMHPQERAQVEHVRSLAEQCGWRLNKWTARFAHSIVHGDTKVVGQGPAQWFREAGLLGTDSYTKHVPEWLFRAPRSAIIGFLSGLFTTDGSIAGRGYGRDDRCLGFASVSRDLMVGTQSLLLRIGVVSRLRTRVRKVKTAAQGNTYTSYVLEITDASNCARLMAALYVPHSKRARFQPTFQTDFEHQWAADRILSIERVAPRAHRCFTIPGDESFTIEDVGVHNSKSRHSSELFPSYYLGRFPDQPVMTISHTTDLATNFGRFVRDMIKSPEYQEIFPGTQIRGDQSAAADWSTTANGKYYAAGVGSSLAGRGAGLLIVDDMVNEQTALQGQYRPEIFEKIYDWYLLARQRLMPNGKILIVNTRWAVNDPTGLIMERSKEDWEVINLPAVWPADEKHPEERILWPEFWTRDEIFAIRAEMPPLKWQATYQQAPELGGGTIIDREWIKWWKKESPPAVEEVIITLDPAFSEKDRADPSAFLVLGIFTMKPSFIDPTEADDTPQRYAIALDGFETWEDFPDLKVTCVDLVKKWKPDAFLIEDKASGVPLFQELVAIGAPVSLFKVSRGKRGQSNDKIARVNSIAPMIRSGRLYFPEGYDWAEKIVKQLTTFPQVKNDDLCFPAGTQVEMADGSTQAIENVRFGQVVATPFGPRRVLRAHQTTVSPVLTLHHERGVLRATANHPVWSVEKQDYVRLDSFTMYDSLCLSPSTPPSAAKPLSSMGASTTGTPTPLVECIDGISLGRGASCTATCGSIISAPSLTGTTSTTGMATAPTTTSPIWSASLLRSTGRAIEKIGRAIRAVLSTWLPSLLSALWPLSGTEVRRGARGTGSTPGKSLIQNAARVFLGMPGPSGQSKPTTAAGVAPSFSVATIDLRSTAAPTTPTATPGEKIPSRHSRVLSTSGPSAPVPVFNLTVEGAECYYADGVLVHNCDCVTMGLIYFRNIGVLRVDLDDELVPDEEDEDDEVEFAGYHSIVRG